MSALKSIIKIAKSDYDTLARDGSIVKGSTTYTYDPNQVLYIVDSGLSDQYVQLGGGGGKLLSQFAMSTDISDLANRINVEATNRQTMDSSITTALANEISNRKDTDPVFIEFPSVGEGDYISSSTHALIMNTVANKKVLFGYISSSSPAVYILTPIHVSYFNKTSVTLSWIYHFNTVPTSMLYTVTYNTSNLCITKANASQLNAPSTIVYDGSNFIDSSCLWHAVNAPKHIKYSTSYSSYSVTLTHTSSHKIFLYAYTSSRFTLPDSSTTGGLINGETFEFINANGSSTSFDYSNYIYTPNNKLYPYPENGTTTSGISYYYIYRNERCKVECTYSDSIDGWYIIKTPLVNTVSLNKPTYAEGLQPMILAYGKGGSYTSGSTGTIYFKYKTFDNSTLYLSRSSEGTYQLHIPQKWRTTTYGGRTDVYNDSYIGAVSTMYHTNLIVLATGSRGPSYYSNKSQASHVYVSVDDIASSNTHTSYYYILITTSDDATANDAMFSFIIYSI